MMIICDFCLRYNEDGKCLFGLKIPKHMGCREFAPGIYKFCSNPNDFVGTEQIVQMATFFGIKGMELKKVKAMAAQAEETRSKAHADQRDAITVEQITGPAE
jgi:hypothetical protein